MWPILRIISVVSIYKYLFQNIIFVFGCILLCLQIMKRISSISWIFHKNHFYYFKVVYIYFILVVSSEKQMNFKYLLANNVCNL